VSSIERHWRKTTRSRRWARPEIRKHQLVYLRREWKVVVAYALIVTLTAPVLWLVPSGWRMFALGVYVTTFAWVLYHGIATESGTVPRQAGVEAEERTAMVLRGGRRHGWKSLNHVYLGRGGDIDHVLLGPAGLVVLETKWSAGSGPGDHALDKVKRDARRLELVVRRAVSATRVHPVIVMWGPSADALGKDGTRRDGVVILPGRGLRGWLGNPRPQVLGPEEQERAWTVLTDQFAAREGYEGQR
jgi:hypothetical protein